MARFMIEVTHEDNLDACNSVKTAFYRTGSHFLTHAEFGCPDEVHKAWLIVEVDSKEEAEFIIPSAFRQHSQIIQLERMDPSDMEDMIEHHIN
jgi:hypothetical protein